MTALSLTDRLTEALLSALCLPADEDTYGPAYSAVVNADEAEVPDPRLQAIFIVEAVETTLGLGLDESRFEAAVAAVRALLPSSEELAALWQGEPDTRLQVAQQRAAPPDAHLEMTFEDRVNGGLDFD